jgi:HlyD family secretion protein
MIRWLAPLVRIRRRWLLLALILLLPLGWWLNGALGGEQEVKWAEVKRGDLVLAVEVDGTLRAVLSSKFGPPQIKYFWEYKIAHMAPEGEEVTAGTPLLAFDTSELEQLLETQQAESDEARKQIERTEKNLDVVRRQDRLRLQEAQARLRKARLVMERSGELSSAQELEIARLDLGLAEKEVLYLEQRLETSARSAEAQLAVLKNQRDEADQRVQEITDAIGQMRITAPSDGTVIYATGWRGEKKKVGDTCRANDNVLELPDLNKMMAEGQVDEADAGKLAEGQRVTFRLDAHPDHEFAGQVASIWKTVRRKTWRNPLKVAKLEIELDETDTRRMRPGMRFRGKLETERIAGALLVPVDAVFLGAEGPLVYRGSLLGHEAVEVELGRRNEDYVEVLEGLEEGDAVSLVDLAERERRKA